MKLEEMTWPEVEAYLTARRGVILPTGSIEQHGPIGLIGTDAICAREIAWQAAELCDAIVAPELAYAPAPFNMSFPGTVSLSSTLYRSLAQEVLNSLAHHGFDHIYILNGHGANIQPLTEVAATVSAHVHLRSWWDFAEVSALRNDLYGAWEGMHATPSEIAITQVSHRVIDDPELAPPRQLSLEYIKAHSGDRHGPPDVHRKEFPDGRVGSHSGLARPEHGQLLRAAAAHAVAQDFADFCQ